MLFLVSNGIVRAHGGTLNIYSGGVGCGSTFSIELPLDAITQPDLADDLLKFSPTAASRNNTIFRSAKFMCVRWFSIILHNCYYTVIRCAKISYRMMDYMISLILPSRRNRDKTRGASKIIDCNCSDNRMNGIDNRSMKSKYSL